MQNNKSVTSEMISLVRFPLAVTVVIGHCFFPIKGWRYRYVGFDFALNKDGQWVLIEGNWGQMVGQMAELKGIRRQFIEYITSSS